MTADAIRLQPEDNVATVLRSISAGETIQVRCGIETTTMIANEPIPLCHKISVVSIIEGQAVIKYGQSIGHAQTAVRAGVHVHIHNLRSARARAG